MRPVVPLSYPYVAGSMSGGSVLRDAEPLANFANCRTIRPEAQTPERYGMRRFALGGHMIWLGRDVRQMHDARVEFLKQHT